MKKGLSILLSLALILSVFTILPVTVSAVEVESSQTGTSKTADEAIAWCYSKVGQSIETFDSRTSPLNYMYQCVDFVAAYYQYLGVNYQTQGGGGYSSTTPPAGWTKIQGAKPQKGDILVYVNGDWGHIGIYESDYSTFHQNFNNHAYVERVTNLRYDNVGVPYWGVVRPNFAGSGNNPTGVLDIATGGVGSVHIRGWAFDKDDYNAQLNIHVYIGGPSGDSNAEGHGTTMANLGREDVHNVYGCGIYHGFDDVIPTAKTGTQKVYVYAINVGGGENVLIGEATVNITPDTEEPTVLEKYFSQVTNNSFRICIVPNDNIGIKQVRIATWSKEDQSDVIWRNAAFNGSGTYFVDISRADYASGTMYYYSHAYIYDYAENYCVCSVDMDYRDNTPPTIEAKYLSEITDNSFRVCVVPKDFFGIKQVRVATWTKYDQSDLIWKTANYNGEGTYFVDLLRSDYADSTKYFNHIYVYDNSDNYISVEIIMDYNHKAIILGDADGDGKVTAVDVTRIMLDIVRLNPGVDHDTLMNGDVDQNGILAITDVTYIQRYLAKLETPFAIGEAIE